MRWTVFQILVVVASLGWSNGKSQYEPSVAFVCDRGAMHMDQEKGWVSDPYTDCMESKEDIKKYCQKQYPKLEITNIVESSDFKHIRGWCPLGKTCDSKEAFKVRPYRCLTGPFQSDALIVPKACAFDHLNDKDACKPFSYWEDMAHKKCKAKSMNTESFAMLLPCGTDVFTGVEFVCCPGESLVTEEPETTTEKVEEKLQTPSINVKITSSEDNVYDLSAVDKYMTMGTEAYKHSEHDKFSNAKSQLLKVNHNRVTKLMKEWSEAKKRVEAMKKIDPKGAEKLSKQITPRFQKEYFALQTSTDSKLVQLDSIHQHHVQENLNSKKRHAAEKLMNALESAKTQPDEVTKYLKRYISVEQKDAHHCVKHYMKTKERDELTAQTMLPTVIEHLTLIRTRITQSIGLLSALDDEKLTEKIETEVKAWLSKHFPSLDGTIRKLKESAKPAAKPETKDSDLPIVSDDKETKSTKKDDVQDTEAVKSAPEIVVTVKKDPVINEEKEVINYKKFADKLEKTAFMDKADLESMKLAIELIEPHSKPQMSHLADDAALQQESNHMHSEVSSNAANSGLSVGTALAVAIAVLGGVSVIILIIVVVKRKSSPQAGNRPAGNTYLEVAIDDNSTAEDRHIVNMQSGYENPTYKLLERRSAPVSA